MKTGVQYAYYDIPNIGETDEAALEPFERDAQYMGAREPLDGPLTPTQRERVVAIAETQVGKTYAWKQTAGSIFGLLPGYLVKGAEEYNCVGLAKAAYEVAGVNGGEGLVYEAAEFRGTPIARAFHEFFSRLIG